MQYSRMQNEPPPSTSTSSNSGGRARSALTILIGCGALVALLLFQKPGALSAETATTGPLLSVPATVQAGSPGVVTIPLRFQRNNTGVTSIAFAMELEETCLTQIEEGPEAAGRLVRFHLPPQFNGAATYHAREDGGGQLQVVVADYIPPLSTLPDMDPLLELTLDLNCVLEPGEVIEIPLTFSESPPASFGSTIGRSVPGSTRDGIIQVVEGVPTPTPTLTPTPDPSVTAEPVNSAPQAQDDTAQTSEYRSVTIDVLANDSDPDGDRLTVIEVTQGAFGAVDINVDSTVRYLPAPGRNGEDLFTYTIDDGRGGLAIGTVHVTVRGVNLPPVAVDDLVVTDEDVPVAFDPLLNDYDVDAPDDQNSSLAIAVLGQPDHGQVVLNDDQSLVYIPDPDFAGTDSMLYAVLDHEEGSAVGQVTFEIRPINDPPTIEPPAQTVFIPGEDVSLPLEYDDVDDDRASLVVRVRRLPPGLAFDQDAGRIVGRVDEDASGDYAGMIRVSDTASTTTLDVTWVVMPEADIVFSLSAATEARGVMLELSAPPGFGLICYQLFRQDVDEEAPAWTPVAPEVTSEPEDDGHFRLLDDSIAQPGRYVYRMVIFADCGSETIELLSNQVEYLPVAASDVIYLPLIREQPDP